MEEDIESLSGGSMVPLALATLAIVLGGAALYFGLTANAQLAPLSESVDEGSSSAARIDQDISSLEMRLAELNAQTGELLKTVERLRLYGSQNEQTVKQVASGVQSNRQELVNLAESMKALASVRTPTPVARNTGGSGDASSRSEGGSAESSAAAGGSSSTYVIKAGDTFGKIANELGVSLDALLDANPEADPRRLRIGQEIIIPAN